MREEKEAGLRAKTKLSFVTCKKAYAAGRSCLL